MNTSRLQQNHDVSSQRPQHNEESIGHHEELEALWHPDTIKYYKIFDKLVDTHHHWYNSYVRCYTLKGPTVRHKYESRTRVRTWADQGRTARGDAVMN
jgi:hypothetical protein